MRVYGYIRVSTDEQADSGAGLEAQRSAILAEAERRGWTLVEILEDAGYSAKDLRRPGIQAALEQLRRKQADGLVVAKSDRLSRSMFDFVGIMETARRQHWALIALDVGVDTSTPAGEAMVSMLATFAQFERRLIGQRTRDAMAALKAQGREFGRPLELPEDVRQRVRRERAAGRPLAAIAADLNADEIPTAHGGRQWWPSTVRAVARSR